MLQPSLTRERSSQGSERRRRLLWLLVGVGGCLALAALACGLAFYAAADPAYPGISLRPGALLVGVRPLSLSFELTNNPMCSVQVPGCRFATPRSGRDYLVVWVIESTPAGTGYTQSAQRLFRLPLP